MIQRLLIKNFALIENLQIDFTEGFNVLSGETGSGKSIILDAISLLIGKRSDRESLFDKEKKCILESQLYLESDKKHLFKNHNLDFESETIIRREILPNGKSRSFINDTPVSLTVLSEIVSSNLEIYSQNQSISLKSEEKQLNLIDKLADSEGLLNKYQTLFTDYNKLQSEIYQIKNGNRLSESELDYLNFQIDELEKSGLRKGEKKDLEEEYNILEHSTSIIENLSKSYNLISEENGINSKLSEIEIDLSKISSFSENLSDLHSRITSIRIELQDLENEIQIQSESVNVNSDSLKVVSERLDHLNTLLVKHRKSEIRELLEVLNEMKLKKSASSDFDKIIQQKEKEFFLKETELKKISDRLRLKRKSICNLFQSNVEDHLKKLGIKSPIFKVEITEKDTFTISGKDNVKFLFSANKGTEVSEIHKVASGGELSRLMLCFSYLVSEFDALSSIIFDEIDTGVSGEIANLMSEMMLSMSKKRQIISVTHLPQIASKADTHFKVFKSEINNRTISEIKRLEQSERVEEIAKMLSGKTVTETAINNAKELLSQ
ncbi:MAG TPA: DNA repair protein RecN [Flavobacteriales bacterium]|nr:DNA repair protein RecN [Flavobacteriales bacterium]